MLFLYSLLLVQIIPKGIANGVVPPIAFENPFMRITVITIFLFINAHIEYAFFKFVVFKRSSILNRGYRFFLRINLITFPLTQILAYAFYIYFPDFFWLYVIFIELLVIIIEWVLLNKTFQRLTEIKKSPLFILKGTFGANIISFGIGLLAFLPALFII
ncbi:MAG: hypothetical protein ACFFKA_20310 [Candidatus Thorarchaeota archaeon]